MDTHVRQFGKWSILFGLASTCLSLVLLVYFDGIEGVFSAGESHGWGIVAVGSLLLHLFSGIPLAISGYYVRRFHELARFTSIFLCAVNLLNPPFGTVLGIYGIWALMLPETEPLFSDPPRLVREAQVRSRAILDSKTLKLLRTTPEIKTPEPHLRD